MKNNIENKIYCLGLILIPIGIGFSMLGPVLEKLSFSAIGIPTTVIGAACCWWAGVK